MSAPATKPRVILGLMTFGPDVNNGARITSLDVFNKALDKFQARGYNEVDTARAYIGGKQEAFTREANWKSRGLKLATKVHPMLGETQKPEVVTALFEKSLKELGTDCVDIAYLHAPDRRGPFAPVLAAMDALHRAGKFVQLGLSNFTSFEVAEVCLLCAANNWVRPTIYQGVYNIITRGIEPELVPACRRYGLDVVIYAPIMGGLVTGAYRPDEVPAEGRFSNKFFGGAVRMRTFQDANFEAVRMIREAVDKAGLTPVETALRWVVHHSKLNIKDGGNDGVLVGVGKMEHLDSNLDDLEKGPLPAEVVEALEAAWNVARTANVVYWHGGDEIKYAYDTVEAVFGKDRK